MSKVVIGIDVGGTNTDSVVLQVDVEEPTVLSSAKAITTRDVTTGIINAIREAVTNALKENPEGLRIMQVNIGTTHFVNAVVQRQDLAKVCVIRLCGPASRMAPPFIDFPKDLKACVNGKVCMVSGGYEFDGREISEVDRNEVATCVTEAKDMGLKNFVVSGIFSPLRMTKSKDDLAGNPYEDLVGTPQEDLVGMWIKETYPEASVTLSNKIGHLGLLERENAAIMNESLKPLCEKTLNGFKKALVDLDLNCPFYLTQNDGTIISEEKAKEYPVFTFASGPTNSMRGSAFLSSINDGIVVDIGGTTTDIGLLMKGFPREASTEVQIGGVRTNFKMPDVLSIGLGGGSYVDLRGPDVKIGPLSCGYRIMEESLIFQDHPQIENAMPTATDIAVATGICNIGNRQNVIHLSPTAVSSALAKIREMVEIKIDQVKLTSSDLPVILVGGGSILIDASTNLKGSSKVPVKPPFAEVANAVGAALSQISGTVDYIVDTKKRPRDETLAEAIELATKFAKTKGADANKKFTVIDKDDTPLAYLPGNAIRVKVKVVGDLSHDRDVAITQKLANFVPPQERQDKQDRLIEKERPTVYDRSGTTKSRFSNYKPHIDANGEWILSVLDIDCIAVGAGILGCGGGGDPNLGRVLATTAIEKGKRIRVISPERMFQNADPDKDVVIISTLMGAPTVIYEKLASGNEFIDAIRCMEDIYKHESYKQEEIYSRDGAKVQMKGDSVYIDNYVFEKGSESAESEKGVSFGNKRIIGLMCSEIGGLSAMEPLIVAAELDMPTVDCDGMGRAFPELQMFCPFIYGLEPYPAALTDEKGRRTVMLKCPTAKHLEDYFRNVCDEMGGSGAITIKGLNREDVFTKTIRYSLSRAWRLGIAVMIARERKESPINVIIQQEGGELLVSGKIVDAHKETTGGFSRGHLKVEGMDKFRDTNIIIHFQNENLVAKNLQNNVVLACTPDLITVVDSDTGEPISTESVRYGMRISVLVLPIPDIMKTEQALQVVGPQAFGYPDVVYKPVGRYRNPEPVAPI